EGLGPGDECGGALRERQCAAARLADEELHDLPVADGIATDGDDLDHRLGAVLDEEHPAAEELGDDPEPVGALLEAAEIDESGRDALAGGDRGDPADAEEDPALARHLDDEADHAGRGPRPAHEDDVADPADAVAVRVEDRAAGEPGDEDAVLVGHPVTI